MDERNASILKKLEKAFEPPTFSDISDDQSEDNTSISDAIRNPIVRLEKITHLGLSQNSQYSFDSQHKVHIKL